MLSKTERDSLQEITKLLFVNAWISLLIAKENCVSIETREELEDIHQILDAVMSQWTFQQELK